MIVMTLWLRIGPGDAVTLPLPGHGNTAFGRRRPVHIVDGYSGVCYTDVSGLVRPRCGAHLYLVYFEVPARARWRLM